MAGGGSVVVLAPGRVDEGRDFGVEDGTESSPDFGVQQNGRLRGVDGLAANVGPGLDRDGLIVNLRRRRRRRLGRHFNSSRHLVGLG